MVNYNNHINIINNKYIKGKITFLTFNDNNIDKNFLLSPIKKALLITGSSALTLFSINTGGMFSPPAVINNSYKKKKKPIMCVIGFYQLLMNLPLSFQ